MNDRPMIISRSDARASGLSSYFTGSPCPLGHISTRRTASASCRECERVKALARSRTPEGKAINAANKRKPNYKAKQKEYSAREERKEKARSVSKNPIAVEKKKSYRDKNSDKQKLYMREYYKEHREKILAKVKERAEMPENKIYRTGYARKWFSEYRKTTNGTATCAMRRMLSRATESKTDRTSSELGYKPSDLIAHIAGLFRKGMSWENHGKWHIDHIVPIAAFISKGITCPRTINALSNLQPLWASENLSKGSKIE